MDPIKYKWHLPSFDSEKTPVDIEVSSDDTFLKEVLFQLGYLEGVRRRIEDGADIREVLSLMEKLDTVHRQLVYIEEAYLKISQLLDKCEDDGQVKGFLEESVLYSNINSNMIEYGMRDSVIKDRLIGLYNLLRSHVFGVDRYIYIGVSSLLDDLDSFGNVEFTLSSRIVGLLRKILDNVYTIFLNKRPRYGNDNRLCFMNEQYEMCDLLLYKRAIAQSDVQRYEHLVDDFKQCISLKKINCVAIAVSNARSWLAISGIDPNRENILLNQLAPLKFNYCLAKISPLVRFYYDANNYVCMGEVDKYKDDLKDIGLNDFKSYYPEKNEVVYDAFSRSFSCCERKLLPRIDQADSYYMITKYPVCYMCEDALRHSNFRIVSVNSIIPNSNLSSSMFISAYQTFADNTNEQQKLKNSRYTVHEYIANLVKEGKICGHWDN